MKFGKPIIYKCSSCKEKVIKPTYLSYTSFGAVQQYSDGTKSGLRSGPYNPPDPVKCPHCGKLFFKSRLKGKEGNRRDGGEWVARPELEDCLKFLAEGGPKTSEEFFLTRLVTWRCFNQKYLREKGFTKKEKKLWLENSRALLDLLIEKEKDEKQMKKLEPSEIMTLHLIMMDLNRNLGNFAECLAGIKEAAEADSRYEWLVENYERECKKKNIFVFELKRKKKIVRRCYEQV